MLVVFDSLTGQTKRFAQKLGYDSIHVKLYEGEPNDDIFLVTRNINFGSIPATTKYFLDLYKDRVVGVAVSGNKNWGENFGKAGDLIEAIYQIPLILKFEGSGFPKDVELVKTWLRNKEEREEGVSI
ncbi:MAG TPA: class Ib ribonucleoside-diphosphate reductase assembly flavoprotein NrdI [Acholeplasma sp.]|nr:class Ib ribonucleoside-diphosphate reductase assembly flavoprotein NrdI [Acholeplasma sp.]